MPVEKPLMELRNVDMFFAAHKKKAGQIGALVGVNFSISEGEIIAVVGESGCGKTTLGKLVAGIHVPTGGEVLYRGRKLETLKGKDFKEYRLGVQMVHQDSYAALNPNKTILHSLSAPLLQHGIAKNRGQALDMLFENLTEVGLTPPEQFLEKYPHQLSGGQRQRIILARALSVKPRLIVADEPVSMVDVSLRISLLDLMARMNKKYNISFIYITHDLGTARYIASHGRVVVMYLGRMIETNNIHSAINNPRHPYFQALVSTVPEVVDGERSVHRRELPLRSLEMPSMLNLPPGCKFCPRCLYYTPVCEKEEPSLRELDGGLVACHNAENLIAASRA